MVRTHQQTHDAGGHLAVAKALMRLQGYAETRVKNRRAGLGQYPQLNKPPGVGIGSMTRVSGPRGFGRFPGSAGLAW